MSTFDTHWLHFEITHGPQAPGAKEDALFWYQKGQKDAPDVATQTEDTAEEEPTPTDTYSDGYEDGRDFAIRRVQEFANTEAHSPDGPALLEFLETLK